MLPSLLPLGGKKGSKEGGRKKLTMEEIQKLAADSSRDIDLDVDEDDDDWDEDMLLAELEEEEGEPMEGVCMHGVCVMCQTKTILFT